MSKIHQIVNLSYEGPVAKVKFSSNNDTTYTYKTPTELKVGDLVICDTPRKMVIGEVIEVGDENLLNPDYEDLYKWIVGVVDFTEYNRLTQLDADLGKSLAKAQRRKIREHLEKEFLISLESTTTKAIN